jgi:hypothetical protein
VVAQRPEPDPGPDRLVELLLQVVRAGEGLEQHHVADDRRDGSHSERARDIPHADPVNVHVTVSEHAEHADVTYPRQPTAHGFRVRLGHDAGLRIRFGEHRGVDAVATLEDRLVGLVRRPWTSFAR